MRNSRPTSHVDIEKADHQHLVQYPGAGARKFGSLHTQKNCFSQSSEQKVTFLEGHKILSVIF